MAQQQNNAKYLPELMAEKDSIEPIYVHAVRLIKQEIESISNPNSKSSETPTKPAARKDLLDVTSGRAQKVECDILVPVERHPHVNFVGRLIGPAGSTMKGIQELTHTRMAVLGKGSVRQKDREKAEELKDKDDKFSHLNYPLHVHVSALGPVPQAFVNLGRAVAEIQKLIIIDEATEAQYAQGPGMGRGMRGGSRGGPGGGMRGRGGPGRGFQRGGRGGGMSRGGGGAGGVGRGNSQGSRGAPRGAGRGRGMGRGQTQQFGQMTQASDSFAEDYRGRKSDQGVRAMLTGDSEDKHQRSKSYDAYGGGAAATGFEQTGYEGYEDSYDTSYDASYGADAGYADASYTEDYSYGQESFDAYGNGASAAAQQSGGYGGQASYRGKIRGGGARGRQKPY